MFRKIGIVSVLAVAGLFLMNRAGLSSYGATAFHKIRESFKHQVPIEFEIERLKYQITQLAPDMKRQLSSIAEEMVATQNLRDQIVDARANLRHQKENLVQMTRDLDKGAITIVYGGREYSSHRIREKLDRDFRSYQGCESELKSKEKLLEAKEKALDAAREQVGSIRAQKQELETQVAQLEADLKTVRLSQTQSKFQFDDSALARCKETLAEIQNRLKVEKKTAELTGDFANDNTIPVEQHEKSAKELTKEIQAYFGEHHNTDDKVVESNK